MKTWIWIAMLFFIGAWSMAPAVHAEDQTAVTMEDLLASSDIVLSEDAQSGAPVAVAAHPEQAEGGISLKALGLKMQALIAAWKLDPVGGLGAFLRENRLINAPVAGGGLIQNGEFTTDLAGWTVANRLYGGASAYGGASSFGPIVAPAGSVDGKFAVVHTGTWDQSSHGQIEQTFRLNQPTSATFTVVSNFITTEPMTGNAGQFNDNGIINVYINDGTGSILFTAFDSRNSSTWIPVTDLPLVLNGDRAAGVNSGNQTGWLTATSGTIFFDRNTNYNVLIEVNDVSDATYDSAILVDMVGLQ